MGFVALERLRWGDGYIEAGEPVPDDEAGRNYDGMLRLHQIAAAGGDHSGGGVAVLKADLDRVTAERDALKADDGSGDRATATVTVNVGDAPQITEALAKAAQTIDDLTVERDALATERDSLADGVSALTAERDALVARVAELEAARPPEVDSPNAEAKTAEAAAAPDPGALPEGVTETSPGWFLLADGTTKIHGRAALDAHLAGQQE